MIRRFRPFLRGLSTTRTGTLGVALTTSSALLLVFVLLLQMAGVTGNSYAGLLTFLLVPGLFILGLILIPVGWSQLRRRTGKSTQELLTQAFPDDMIKADTFGSSLAVTIAGLTVVNAGTVNRDGFSIPVIDEPVAYGTGNIAAEPAMDVRQCVTAMALGKSVEQALKITISNTGQAIFYNAAAVGLGFFVLVFAAMPPLGRMGWMIALTMLFSSMASMTVLPALLLLRDRHKIKT